jgi:hypothetical protein
VNAQPPRRAARLSRSYNTPAPSWRDRDSNALRVPCAGDDAEMWLSSDSLAASACFARCPAQRECLAEALADPESVGVRGGFTEQERAEKRAKKKARTP